MSIPGSCLSAVVYLNLIKCNRTRSWVHCCWNWMNSVVSGFYVGFVCDRGCKGTTQTSWGLRHQGNYHLAKSTTDYASLRELVVKFNGLWTWEKKSCYCHTFILAVLERLKSEVTIEIVFNILKGRTYIDVKGWLYLFGFIVYWYAWV